MLIATTVKVETSWLITTEGRKTMDKKPSFWQMLKIKLSMGEPFAKVTYLGEVDHTVIRFKEKYLSIMEGKDGEMNFGWSDDPHMFPDVNINDFWTAVPPESREK